jgi:uncharacterized protein
MAAEAAAQLRIRVRPGSAADALAWDPWRNCWVVSCRAPAVGGKANRAVAELVADRLGLPRSSVRWVRAGRSRSKVLSLERMDDLEVERRLLASLDARST